MIISIALFLLFACATAQCQSNNTLSTELEKLRKCHGRCENATPRICYYHWHLEHYHVLGPACGTCGHIKGNTQHCFNDQCITAVGIERGVMSINRKIPGPPIHVCKDDLIVVDVTNKMGGTGATIHWHGIHQRETPYYDGVPFITQCPIDFATTFRYAFRASEAGTQFYHSHSGHHKVNGHYGGIVVRRPSAEDPNSSTYDKDMNDHLIVISDWMDHLAEMFVPGLPSSITSLSHLLINGKGTVHDKTNGRSTTKVPLEVFRVQRGHRYRFRFINSMSHVCPALLDIENHSLLIVASDSFDLQPVTVDSLITNSGERYDFVVDANALKGNFWIRVRAIGPCEAIQVQQFAVLSYAPPEVDSRVLAFPNRRFPYYLHDFHYGPTLNHPNTTCGVGDPNNYCITDLSSYVERPDIIDVEPDHEFYFSFDERRQSVYDIFGNQKFTPFHNLHKKVLLVSVVNNISLTFPSFPPLTQPEEVRDDLFCDEDNIPERCDRKHICYCTHRIKVKKDAIVQLTVIDGTATINTINHPFHLHGYEVLVMGMGQHPDRIPMTLNLVQELARTGRLRLAKTRKLVMKDTISIPSKGYTIFRFKADNPGWWMLHCHYDWHLTFGMGLVVQVGETNEMVRPPPEFPKCNNYQPNIDNKIFSS